MRVGKWGDSLAIYLPSDVVDALKLQEGDEVDVELAQGPPPEGPSLRIARNEERTQAFAALSALAVAMPEGFRFSREDAYARDRDGE